MSFELSKIARKSILNLQPYSSARDEFSGTASIFLDANENPYNTQYNRYPDPLQFAVKSILAHQKQVVPEQMILGNGSDEIIDLLIRSFCEPGEDEIIILPPTYGMYQVYADINAVKTVEVPLNEQFNIDVPAVKNAMSDKTKIIFLCSPNNPSGNLLDIAAIKSILTSFDGIVVIDEAYIDFSGMESWATFTDLYPNLFVMQTLSKAWGLAGIRLGIGIADNSIIELLNKVKPPYNISSLTQEKALVALQHEEEKNEIVIRILQERERLQQELLNLGQVKQIYPSDANFLLVKVNNANDLYKELIEESIVVRNRSSVILCDNCLRITIGTKEENDALLDALKKVKAL